MTELHEILAERVTGWRTAAYAHDSYPAVGEILAYARNEDGSSRYLREPQIRALETYWYLRLVEGTPRIGELYERLIERPMDRLKALGLDIAELTEIVVNEGYDGLLNRIRTDDELVRRHRLEALRETMSLQYPSYILALAMGAGKTILIGAIVATEFALAIEYPDAEQPFVANALVFAPGKTIIESLRELASIRFEDLLPPRLYKPFAASLKLTFTRDGEKDISVTRGSRFNLVVTNTEKIRIQARPVRRNAGFLQLTALTEEAREEANLRLQTIASLPHLGVFSDEAHHTYGQSLDAELKRVRQTVDYLAAETNVIAVVNTTGTPYFRKQPLKDVVVWYGLRQGIEDNILKDVKDNVYEYDFEPENADEFVAEVVTDFFATYRDLTLPDGSPAKLALYFPQTDDLADLRPHVELAVSRAGLPATAILTNTSLSTAAEVDAFNRLNDPLSSHRVILLVNKGTEGWNCPSLFATALARRLRTSNNFVLQAATRCLRQVPGNERPARIYLARANVAALDSQLRETYGETLADLKRQPRETHSTTIRVRKSDVPPMHIKRPRRILSHTEAGSAALAFSVPTVVPDAVSRTVYDLGLASATGRVLRQTGDALQLEVGTDTVGPYRAASALAAAYRLDAWAVLDALRAAYPGGEVPVAHLPPLSRQLEEQTGTYAEEVTDEDSQMAILNPEAFREEMGPDGQPQRVATISYPADRAALIWPPDRIAENPGDYGFHYAPYNFDSNPESELFESLLAAFNLDRATVRDVYFTGAISDPKKTDLSFSYLALDGTSHRYTPDFAIHTTDDRWILIEVKARNRRDDPIDGAAGRKALALQELVDRNPGRLERHVAWVNGTVGRGDVEAIRRLAQTGS
ncbi:MAG: DEAD/DEAH box helicase family protein [Candidatus Limnocylindria bacterium]